MYTTLKLTQEHGPLRQDVYDFHVEVKDNAIALEICGYERLERASLRHKFKPTADYTVGMRSRSSLKPGEVPFTEETRRLLYNHLVGTLAMPELRAGKPV